MSDYKQRYLQMKNKYLDYRDLVYNQLAGGAIYSNPDIDKSYTGSGVMLFELYKGKPTVILFENRRQNEPLYEDLGGGLDSDELLSKDPLKVTAIREAFEESRGLINITPKHLNIYVDAEYKSKYYRNYLVAIKYDALIDDYNHNKSIIDKNSRIVDTMKETFSIEKFYIDDLIKDGIMESTKGLSFLARNIDNKQKNIYTRSVDILQEVINKDIIQEVISKPLEFIQLKTLTSV